MNCSSNWRDYTNACWAANWHRFFTDDPNDARGKMGWPNRFQDALANAAEVFNYYSSGDEVFWEFSTVPGELEGLRNISSSAYAWQKQETHKGSKDAVGTAEGGWGFNMLAYDPPVVYSAVQAGLMVADGTITSTPVFNCEFMPMLSDTAVFDSQMYALAKCVPALSSPMGGVQVVSDVISENFNLNDLNRPNGWGRFNTYWQHSDMKDMSYFYVFQLYDELITKGGLR